MSTSSQNPTSTISLGPISPVRCPDAGCYWAAFGIPDQYGEARAWHLSAHRAEEHGEPLSAEQIAFGKERGHRLPTSVTLDSSSSQATPELLSPERRTEILRLLLSEHRTVSELDVVAGELLDELDRVQRAYIFDTAELKRRLAELESAAFGDAKVRLFTPVDQIRHLHTALARQMARAETVSRLATEQRERADKAEAELAELEKDPSPLLCADCGHPEGAHHGNGEDECNAAETRLVDCSCVYFIPRGGA